VKFSRKISSDESFSAAAARSSDRSFAFMAFPKLAKLMCSLQLNSKILISQIEKEEDNRLSILCLHLLAFFNFLFFGAAENAF
jgi:hypothetical protein